VVQSVVVTLECFLGCHSLHHTSVSTCVSARESVQHNGTVADIMHDCN
jgi:hypothetical protein